MMKKFLGGCTLAIFAFPLWAGPFTIGEPTCVNNNPGCVSQLPQINAQLRDFEAKINDELPKVDAKQYATAIGNSVAIALKGLTVDYGSHIEYGLLGGGLGIGIVPIDQGVGIVFGGKYASLPPGMGAQASLVGAFNLGLLKLPTLGPIDPKKGILFANFISANLPERAIYGSAKVGGSSLNLGAHVRYKLVDRFNYLLGLFEWSGLDITTGLNYSSLDLKLKTEIKKEASYGLGGGAAMKSSYHQTLIFNPDVGYFNIPIEASTGVKLLWLFRLYGGLGLDFNLGHSDINVRVPGTIEADYYTGSTVVDKVTAPTNLNLAYQSRPDILALRTFLGLQLDLTVFNIFYQVNISPTANAVGITFGGRFYY